MKETQGRNGGTLKAQQPGDPGLPGAGRKISPFKQAIKDIAESEGKMQLEGFLVIEGIVTDQKVKVEVKIPSAKSVVMRMFKKAMKGNVPAAKWLAEAGYGKVIYLGDDEERPLGGGFAVVLPPNGR